MGVETYAVRIHGVEDLRLDKFELPEIQPDEVMIEIITDSLCMSSYKAAKQGQNHKRIPNDVDKNPTIVGHEFSAKILEVGKKYKGRWEPGQMCTIQPAINYEDGPVGILSAPGYSYRYLGGDATKAIIPKDVLLMDCLLDYSGDAFYKASLAEPLSCVIGAEAAHFHVKIGNYNHIMGITQGGNLALLAGCGPMGLAAISYLINGGRKPGLLLVTDIDEDRLARAKRLLTSEDAAKKGVKLVYLNSAKDDLIESVRTLSGGKMMHDVFVFAPVKPVIEQGQKILGFEGTLNFFAGPADTQFSANFNFYDVHYNYHKVVGTSGGNIDDLKTALKLMSDGDIDPSFMVSHIGGLDSCVETTLNLPHIPGGKKLLYTHHSFPLTAIDDFETISKKEGPYKKIYTDLAHITRGHNGLWSPEAEKYFMEHAPKLKL